MKKLIDKDTLVAEIERRIKEYKTPTDGLGSNNIRLNECKDILSFLNTLEVKEVDLEKELIEWHKEHFKKGGTFIGKSGFYLTNNSQMDIAKHFFKLGLEVKQG